MFLSFGFCLYSCSGKFTAPSNHEAVAYLGGSLSRNRTGLQREEDEGTRTGPSLLLIKEENGLK